MHRTYRQLEALLKAVKAGYPTMSDLETDATPADQVVSFDPKAAPDRALVPWWWEGSREAFLKRFRQELPPEPLRLTSSETLQTVLNTLRHIYDEVTLKEPSTPS